MGELGEAYKRRIMERGNLTESGKKLLSRTRVLTRPDSYFNELSNLIPFEYPGKRPYEIFGYTPEQPFSGQPFTMGEVYTRQGARSPRLTLGNYEYLGDTGWVTPEEVIPHELRHVADLAALGYTSEPPRARVEKTTPRASSRITSLPFRGFFPRARVRPRYIYNPEEEENYR